jgi:formyl-CoA transferase
VPNRNANREALTAILRARLAGVDGVAVSLALLKAGVPAGPLNTIEETLTDPQTQVRDMVIEADGYRGIGTPVKMGRTPGSMRHTPPDFGADNEDVLRAAGYSEDEISQLFGLGAVVAKRAG